MFKKTVVVLMCCVSWSWAVVCPTGYSEWKNGCAADLKPESAASIKPSDELPSRHPQPAWQRGEVKVIEIRSFTTESEEADAQVKFAQLHSTTNSTGKASGLTSK